MRETERSPNLMIIGLFVLLAFFYTCFLSLQLIRICIYVFLSVKIFEATQQT